MTNINGIEANYINDHLLITSGLDIIRVTLGSLVYINLKIDLMFLLGIRFKNCALNNIKACVCII